MSPGCYGEQIFPGANFSRVELGLATALTRQEPGSAVSACISTSNVRSKSSHKTNIGCCVIPLQNRERSHEAQLLLTLESKGEG